MHMNAVTLFMIIGGMLMTAVTTFPIMLFLYHFHFQSSNEKNKYTYLLAAQLW